jgi:hypothetical protein
MPEKRLTLDWFNEWELQHWAASVWKTKWGPKPTAAPKGVDLHVIRGTKSRPLRQEMLFWEFVDEFHSNLFHEGDDELATEPNKLTLEFLPRLAPNALAPDGTDFLEGLGIRVNKQTGEVEAVSPPPAGKRIRNFILDATATLKRSATKTDTLNKRAVRVHIYDKLVDAWITPSTLTVHEGSRVRATVLASFSLDGEPDPPLVGDITRLTGLTWSSNDPSVTFNSIGEIQTTKTGTFMITATLPAVGWGGKVISSNIEVVDAWADKPFVRATLIAGPGVARLDEVPNVLVVPDGFKQEEEEAFNAIVVEAFDDMMKRLVARPFDLFLNQGSINIWSIFVPSRERGASALYEAQVFPDEGKTRAVAIGLNYRAPASGMWGAGSVNGFAGLPVRSDAFPETAPQADQIQKFKDKLDEWNAIFGPITAAQVPFHVWQVWTSASKRTLIDEVDTAFGIAFGVRPEFSDFTTDNTVTGHEFRTRREHIDPWLARITDGDGPLIGHVWAGDGKDNKYIVSLLGGAREGGAEGPIAAASLGNDPRLIVSPVGAARHTLLPFELPQGTLGAPEMSASTRGTIVHELAHAFGLQDEYTDLGGSAGNATFPTAGNVQPRSELLDKTVPPRPLVGDGLIGDQLRWRAPRIARAGVVDGDIFKTGTDEFLIPLRKGQKLLFRRDDKVFLRQRPLRGTKVVGTGAAKKTVLVLAKVSVPLRVLSDVQVSEQIIVTADGAAFDPKEFDAPPPFRSIVFVPVPPPPDAAAAGETYADLVPLVVRKHITKTGWPLNRGPDATSGDVLTCADHSKFDAIDWDSRQQIRNAPTKIKFEWRYRWVGAFDGGARFGCDIFHPSPICAMNHSTQRFDGEMHGTFHRLAAFCPVCAYILVDTIDPNLHGELDRIYSPAYVEALP